jgi:hypothetical protein
MMNCQLCQVEFKTNQGLVSHLTYNKSKCKTDIKLYYDKFFRREGEGLCKECANETAFYGLKKGYLFNICGECNRKNKGIEKNYKRSQALKETLQEKTNLRNSRKTLIELLRKQTIEKTNKKQCQICGLIFDSIRSISRHISIHSISSKNYYDQFFKSVNEDKCLCYDNKKCKINTRFISLEFGYSSYCSSSCGTSSPIVISLKQENSITKYGSISPLKNPVIRQKWLENINKSISDRNDEIIEKRKNTVLVKYGVEFISQLKSAKEKFSKTHKELKNTKIYQQTRKKIYDTFLNNTFIPRMNYILDYLNFEMLEEYKGAHLNYKFKCKTCGSVFETLWNSLQQGKICSICNQGKSKAEIELSTWLKTFGIEFIENDRNMIAPYELDFFFPSKNIAIEYCGLYYHSELVNTKDPQIYHLNKLKMCLNKNIMLIQIFEDEWMFKKDIVKKRIEHILLMNQSQKIYARKCIIKEIDTTSKNNFLNQYHIQGQDTSSIKLGAFYNNELVSVITFSKGRLTKGQKNKQGVWELNRFVSNNNYSIPGIASKLLTYFKNNYYWLKIYSYADRRWSSGNLYRKLNFSFLYETNPGYWYFKDYKRIHRFNLRKRPDEPKDIPEWELRHRQGYYRIWDCGHLKFEMINEKIAA